MNKKLFDSRIKSNIEGNDDRNRNTVFADTNSQYVELINRVNQLENYTYGTSK